MIVTVNLNAAIDRTLTVPNFSVGFRHRATDTFTLPGGKGVNVARTVKTVGQPVIATGFAGGRTGDRIVADLNREGILSDFVRIEAESRTSTAVLDPTTNVATEINEYGPQIQPHEMELMLEKLDYLCKAADIVVLAGSLPRDVDVAIYAKLTAQVKSHGVAVLFNAYGEPLRHGIKAGPDVVFPNQAEAEMVIGYEFSGDEDLIRAPQRLRELGPRSAVVTYRHGCAAQLADGDGVVTVLARMPRVEVVAMVGAEDALVGGYAARMLEGGTPLECLRFGMACSAANALKYGAGVFDVNDVHQLIDAVEIEEVSVP